MGSRPADLRVPPESRLDAHSVDARGKENLRCGAVGPTGSAAAASRRSAPHRSSHSSAGGESLPGIRPHLVDARGGENLRSGSHESYAGAPFVFLHERGAELDVVGRPVLERAKDAFPVGNRQAVTVVSRSCVRSRVSQRCPELRPEHAARFRTRGYRFGFLQGTSFPFESPALLRPPGAGRRTGRQMRRSEVPVLPRSLPLQNCGIEDRWSSSVKTS